MKKLMIASMSLLFAHFCAAQVRVKGHVTEKNVASPVVNATVRMPDGKTVLSDTAGYFTLQLARPGDISLEVSAIGFKTFTGHFSTRQPDFNIELERKAVLMEPVEIRAVRASDPSPFSKTTLSAATIQQQNLGQDLPFILNQSPSVVVNADAGNGVGYTGIRVRGSDPTRINMTINGIPYNAAESQGIFFVNLPDLASSTNSIQLQRGVGTSSNGSGAFGATMNLLTNEVQQDTYAELNNSYGSFNTWKNTLRAGTGLIDHHFTFDARLSHISSDGYIDRARSDLQSFYVSGAYLTAHSSLRLNVFSGKEKTYQAWYGVPESLLKTNRTFNAAGTERPGSPYNNETDNYKQTHYQLFYNQSLSPNWNLNLAMFYTKGAGYYEQYKAGQSYADYGLEDPVFGTDTLHETDLIRQLWLDNQFFGNTFSLQYKKPATDIIIGGGWNRYLGHHHGDVIWAAAGFPDNYRWYYLEANKTDLNIYGKWQQKISGRVSLFADLQLRKVNYNIYGFRDNPSLVTKNDWLFFNPKLGINYTHNDWRAYASVAVGNKEPNREDFEAGKDGQPSHETLYDAELGIEKRNTVVSWAATYYYMKYHNQLVLTGQINDVGAYTRTNIPNSYRTGIELTGRWKPINWLDANGNLSLSSNKVMNYTSYYDDYDQGGQKSEFLSKADIAFSPAAVAGYTINIRPFNRLELSLIGKYVSRQYLDNTSREDRSLDPFYTQELRLSYRINPRFMKEILLVGQAMNIFDSKYEPNGYTFSYYYGGSLQTENYYYPMAGINFMFALNCKF
jgi:iron complex outermembrane receptor protein